MTILEDVASIAYNVTSLPVSLRDSIDACNLLFGTSRCTSVARLSKVAYTMPAWRPSAEVGGSAVGVCDVVAIFERARAIQIFKKTVSLFYRVPAIFKPQEKKERHK